MTTSEQSIKELIRDGSTVQAVLELERRTNKRLNDHVEALKVINEATQIVNALMKEINEQLDKFDETLETLQIRMADNRVEIESLKQQTRSLAHGGNPFGLP